MNEYTVKMGSGGRFIIPARFRKALGVADGDNLILRLTKGRLEILTSRQAVAKAQGLVRKYVASDRRLAEELISERREEVLRG